MGANHCARQGPTLRQLEVLHEIAEHTRRFKYPPTVRGLCFALGVQSTNGMADHIRALVRKGLAEKDAMVARSIRVTEKGARFLSTFVPSGEGGRASFNLRRSESDKIKAGCPAVNEGEG